MTEEEKQELEGLRAKESLTEEEKTRVAELEAKEEPLSAEDEFDKAFDEALAQSTSTGDSDTSNKDDDLEGLENGQKKPSQDADTSDQDQDDTSIFNDVPDGQDSQSDMDNGNDYEVSPEQRIANLEAELAKEKQRTSSWNGRIQAAEKRAKEAEAKLRGNQQQDNGDDDTIPGDDDDPILSEFIEEFPSLEKPIKLMAKKIANEIVENKLGDIPTRISSVQETVEQEAIDRHLAKITQAHPDWKQIHTSGALSTWISKQPKFMQPGLQAVVDEGSAEDIIELFDTYKKSTGRLRNVNHKGRKSPQQKARELEAVTHDSSGPPADKKKADPNDFDAAWEEANSAQNRR